MGAWRRIGVAVLATALLVESAAARTSVFTARGSGPLYWSIYGWNYDFWTAGFDPRTPEAVWTANVDWVEANFRSAGYDLVSTDGWLEANTPVTADGFMQTYGLWDPTHDWAYYATNVAAREMRLGVYFNPLWVTQAAWDQNNLAAGTVDVHVRDLVSRPDEPEFPGLYWVDASRPGAREWVQGYVAYLRTAGVRYLRIDFLTDYELRYGTAAYALALAWMNEAAGDDLFLSLVTPNCFDDCATELQYGDMIRVSQDTQAPGSPDYPECRGGWCSVSGRNRSPDGNPVRPRWPRFDNVWDGFTYFSRVSGRGRLILDGDFLLLGRFADDAERRTALSLYVLAGSPVAIADYCPAPGACPMVTGSPLDLFRNPELLELNALGLVGHPLDPDGRGPRGVDGERWVGRLSDGRWIVGLFNRGETPQRKRIRYRRHLGIRGKAETRDLWAHADLGLRRAYRVMLGPHESRLLAVTPRSPRRAPNK